MLEEISQSLKRDFGNRPADEREYVDVFRAIRGTKM